MLVAYLDEFGHVGPYIDTTHRKFMHNPIFGYAGIILPETAVRPFGARFEKDKARHFRNEIIESHKHPRRWEKKGAEIFTTGAYRKNPGRTDVVAGIAEHLHHLGGDIVFYGEQKKYGSPAESGHSPSAITRNALIEVVRRMCRVADERDQSLVVLLDSGGPMPREEAITAMATFIYSAGETAMRRIIEVPMELESHRYGAIQFADWVCGILSRACHYHFTESEEFDWAPPVLSQIADGRVMRGSRVWLPDKRRPITMSALKNPRKWIKSESDGSHHRGLTYNVGDALRAARH